MTTEEQGKQGQKYGDALSNTLIYIMRINDDDHKGCVKIGVTSIDKKIDFTDLTTPNSEPLKKFARERIAEYTRTAGVKYELLYTESTVFVDEKGGIRTFSDGKVHAVLQRSGVKKKVFDTERKANEWYITDLSTAMNAIQAVKEGRSALNNAEITETKSPIILRPEQRDAVDRTKKRLGKGKRMLWNAKMRFGKTISALQFVRESSYRRILILTHRPVVDDAWFTDYHRVFYEDNGKILYGSRGRGMNFADMEKKAKEDPEIRYIYFASMQDLRGSKQVGGNFDKNNEIFAIPWDLLIVDEAHEGTQTALGQSVIKTLLKDNTKCLDLTGTAFNLIEQYGDDEIFTWDYVMEQRAKAMWDLTHFGDPNPYADLPRLNIYTFDLGKLLPNYIDVQEAFNFHEFFRVDKNGAFVHKQDILNFLDLICKRDDTSNYPYSTEEYRDNFRHSLWMVPGVREARALKELLNNHIVFSAFDIINVAGDGDEDAEGDTALETVRNAIGKNPGETRTITLSCGRLTTGVSVPEWTAVFMLAGSYSTSASSYMQTIFRVQTPYHTADGKMKTECFVFDFAPDRTLKVVADAAELAARNRNMEKNGIGVDPDEILGEPDTDKEKSLDKAREDALREFLNFCPIISYDGTRMVSCNVTRLLQNLEKAYIDRIVSSGFDSAYLYEPAMLANLAPDELKDFDDLRAIVGTSASMPKTDEFIINKQGFTEEELKRNVESAERKRAEQKPLTQKEKEALEEIKRRKRNRDTAVSILRGISRRMPLMLYGAELTTEEEEGISLDNFTNLIDPKSWEEFMPHGVTRRIFEKYKKYYKDVRFRESGKRIRALAKSADSMPVEERIERITGIFANFRNPDKETVLTPWRVVNMHLGDTVGGYVFYDDNLQYPIVDPRFVEQDGVTDKIFTPSSRILEINSKSGLYPLYMAYGIYRSRLKADDPFGMHPDRSPEEQQRFWDRVIAENIFVVCKTPMAVAITNRTLRGFRNARTNAKYVKDLVNTLQDEPEKFTNKVVKLSFWNIKTKGDDTMKFNAIVGNPPYQEMDGGSGSGMSAVPLYQLFIEASKKIEPTFLSMITPARWFFGGKGLDDFRKIMLNDKQTCKLIDYETSSSIFPNVDIAGGICYFLWKKGHNGQCSVTNLVNGKKETTERDLDEFHILIDEKKTPVFIRNNKSIPILRKVRQKCKDLKLFSEVVAPRSPFSIPSTYAPKAEGVPCYFTQKIGRQYVHPDIINDDNKLLNVWKFLAPKAPIAGQTDFSKPVGFYYSGNTVIAEPGTCCSETWLVLKTAKTKEELESFKTYLFTKTVRFLILQTVLSQNMSRRNFCFVPDLGHYEGTYTDEMLREMWNITDDEWAYIDSKITSVK